MVGQITIVLHATVGQITIVLHAANNMLTKTHNQAQEGSCTKKKNTKKSSIIYIKLPLLSNSVNE